MPFSILADLVFSLFNLLKGSIVVAIPLFIAALLASVLHRKIMEKLKLSWFKSALLLTYAALFVAVVLLYLVPYLLALNESEIGPAPEQFQLSMEEQLYIAGTALLKIIFLPIVFTVMALPFEFVASFAREKLQAKFKWHYAVNLFIAVYIVAIIASLIVLSNSWIVSGMLYLLYWG